SPSTALYCLPPLSTMAYFILFSWSSLRRMSRGFGFQSLRRIAGKPGFKRPPQQTAAGAEADNIIHVGYGDVNGWRTRKIKWRLTNLFYSSMLDATYSRYLAGRRVV
ncbi:MAG: hypothetical protein KKC71_10495, partial [Chloroflexi bacterium]|nr:hypothetical protein [Chloroflexota bacterium]